MKRPHPPEPGVPSHTLQDRDRALMAGIDAVFTQVRADHPGALPCSRGCHYCCVAFFEVSTLDLWRLREGLRRLDPDIRAAMLERAACLVDAAGETVPGWGAPWDVRDIGEETFVELAQRVSAPCPALGRQGECLVYDHRPRICHLQGLSFYDPDGGAELPDFCADTFGDEDYSAIPPQPLALYQQWEEELELRQAVSLELPVALAGGYRTFVAGALMTLAELDTLLAPGTGVRDPEVGPAASIRDGEVGPATMRDSEVGPASSRSDGDAGPAAPEFDV